VAPDQPETFAAKQAQYAAWRQRLQEKPERFEEEEIDLTEPSSDWSPEALFSFTKDD
jgi:hypothetical protein